MIIGQSNCGANLNIGALGAMISKNKEEWLAETGFTCRLV